MAKENFFKRFIDSFRGGSEGDLEDRVDTPPEELEETPVEEAKPFMASPLAGVANMIESQFYSAGAGPRVDTAEARSTAESFREEHEPYRLEPDGDKNVCISKAYLYEIHPLTSAVTRHPLTPLRIGVSANCVVYSTYKTDNHGHIKVEDGVVSYSLQVGEDLPDSIHFELPNEFGSGGVDGEYFIPICYIKNYRFDRKQFSGGREARLMGSLEGHRGPMWWISGYNALQNIGGGANVYKNYTRGDDFKNLRSLIEKGQTRNCDGDNKISGLSQVKVAVAAGGDEIEIHGNRYNKTWKVGDKRQAIIEDGLVRCIGNLLVEELEPVTVVAAPTTTSNSTTSVAACPSASQIGEAWSGGAVNSNMVQGTPHSTMWAGGTKETLPWVQICVSSGSTSDPVCYWVIGEQIPEGGSSEPDDVIYVSDPTQVTGVTSAVQITGVASTASSDLDPVNVVKDLTCVSIVSNTNTTEVFKSTGSNLRVVKESTGDECNTCPEE
jgi:hypothetical protein